MPEIEGPLLAIDTSTDTGTVAVGTASGVLSEATVSVRSGHSSTLVPAIDRAMSAAGVERGSLAGVVVGSGPGSFTGLRIAGATAKGIVSALGIPLFAYSSLLAIAAQAWASSRPVCALTDARGRNVYTATYLFNPTLVVIHAPEASTIDEVMARFGGAESPLFIGSGAERHRTELIDRVSAIVAAPHFGVPRAAALLWLASRAETPGRVADPAAWEPDYLRPSGAERIAAAKTAEAGGGEER